MLAYSCEVLEKEFPETVSDWGRAAQISPAYMRRLWSECASISPKHLLFLYRLYREAFQFFNAAYIEELDEEDSSSQKGSSTEHRRLMQYYLDNKELFERFLAC
jgi:hypothetical protein